MSSREQTTLPDRASGLWGLLTDIKVYNSAWPLNRSKHMWECLWCYCFKLFFCAVMTCNVLLYYKIVLQIIAFFYIMFLCVFRWAKFLYFCRICLLFVFLKKTLCFCCLQNWKICISEVWPFCSKNVSKMKMKVSPDSFCW